MMATYKVTLGHDVSIEIIEEGRADTEPSIVMPALAYPYSQILNVPMRFTVLSDTNFEYLLNLLVGESLPYKRRETMLNLARYTRWPYTN